MRNRTQIAILLLLGLLVALVGAPAISAQGGDEEPPAVADEQWPQDCPVSNVPAAFADLDQDDPDYDPVPFAFLYWHGDGTFVGDDPTEMTHYQDLRRFNNQYGTPYLLLTRNGNPITSGDDFPAELLVARMYSQATDGRVFTTNCADTNDDACELENFSDGTVYSLHFKNNYVDGADIGWRHAGGGQIVDGVYVVPLEKTCASSAGDVECKGDEEERGALAFVELQDLPYSLPFIGQTDTYSNSTDLPMIGVVGVTKLPTGKYLFAITGGSFDHGKELIFLQSTTDDLRDPDLKLEWKFKWYCNNLTGGCSQWCGACYWDSCGHGGCGCSTGLNPTLEFQTLNFVSGTNGTLSPEDDTLWLIGTSNTCYMPGVGEDRARLYQVSLDYDGNGNVNSVSLAYQAEAHLNLGDPWDLGDLDAAGGVYVSPKGRMALYTGPHDNTGWEVTGCTNPSDTELCKAYQMGQFAAQDHDNVPPETSLYCFCNPVTEECWISMSASDDCGSGVAGTWYSIDNGGDQPYEDGFAVTDDGVHTIRAYSVDNMGNDGEPKECSFSIDRTPPTTTLALEGVSGDNWWAPGTTVILNASDDGSGVEETLFSVDGGDWQAYAGPFTVTGDGDHTVSYYSVDNNGNQETQQVAAFKIDATPPTGSIQINKGASSTYAAMVRVSALATDALSGPWQVRFRDPGGSWTAWKLLGLDPYCWLLPNPLAGNTYRVYAQFRDRAGNQSAEVSDTIVFAPYPARPRSASYRLGASTFGASGFEAGSASYGLQGTLGQPSMIGLPASTTSGLASGYWAVQGHGIASYPVYLPLVLRGY
jgi:hypothetical protein